MLGYLIFGGIILLAANFYFGFVAIPYAEFILPGLAIIAVIYLIIKSKKRVKIRKIGRDEIILCKGGNNIILSDYIKKHILEHTIPGKGSVFKKIDFSKIKEAIASIPQQSFMQEGGPGLVTMKVKNSGYNLVELSKNIPKKYSVIKKGKVTKTEGKDKISVPAYIVSNKINQFATNLFTVIVRPSDPKYLPDNLKKDIGILQDLKQGKSFSVLTAFPGDPSIPPASNWKKTGHAIIIPDSGKNAVIN